MSRTTIRQSLTPARIQRLYRFIRLVNQSPLSRENILKKLKLNLRGFYRDLEKIKELKIELILVDGKYQLNESIDSATAKLPFPDPKLNLREAQQLSRGRSLANEKIRKLLEKWFK